MKDFNFAAHRGTVGDTFRFISNPGYGSSGLRARRRVLPPFGDRSYYPDARLRDLARSKKSRASLPGDLGFRRLQQSKKVRALGIEPLDHRL